MRRLFETVFCALGLAIYAVAQQNVTRASSTKTTTTAPVITSLSSTAGPFLAAYSYTWSQYITPTIVGTVQVTVNEATNETYSRTVYHSEYATNGSVSLITRTDTNSLGTVTAAVNDINGGYATLVYPTNYFDPYSEMTWSAWWPISTAGEQAGLGAFVSTLGKDGTCCLWSSTYTRTPAHTPFAADVSPTNTADPSGWLYTLIGADIGDRYEVLSASEISSLWAPTSLGIKYDGCPHTSCIAFSSTVAPASAVQSVGNLLATSTTTISSASSTSSSKTTPSSTPTALPEQNTSTPSRTTLTSPASTPTSSPATVQSIPSPKTSAPPSITQTTPSPSPITKASSSPTTSAPQSTQPPILTKGDQTISPDSASSYIISGQPLAPGSSFTLGSGSSTTIIAIHTSGSRTVLAIGTSSSILTNVVSPSYKTTITQPPVLTIGDQTISPDSASNYVISGQTLAAGSSITIGSGSSTTIIALYTSGSRTVLAIGTSSSILSNAVSLVPVTEIGGTAVATTSESEIVVGGETLTPGEGVTVGGTTITDIGGYVWMGLGSTAAATSSRTSTGDSLSVPNSPPGTASVSVQTTSGSREFGVSMRVVVAVFVLLMFLL